MIDLVQTTITVIQIIIQIRNDVQSNTKQCHRLIDRLIRIVPMLETWRARERSGELANDKYFAKTFTKFYDFLKELQAFLLKFVDKSYFKKVFMRNKDLEMFEDYNNDLHFYIQELQLGVTFNIKECQDQDVTDRHEDLSAIRAELQQMNNMNQQVFADYMEQMIFQFKSFVDLKLSPSSSISGSSQLSNADVEKIEEKLEALSFDESKKTVASTTSQKKSYDDLLNELRLLALSELECDFSTKDNFIGSGTFGDVYRGKYNNQTVAVKVLRDNTAIGIKALKKEALIMQLLASHKNLIAFHGAQIEQKPYLLVLELALCSLYDLLYDDTQPMKVAKDDMTRKLQILYDVVKGTEFLHSLSVILVISNR